MLVPGRIDGVVIHTGIQFIAVADPIQPAWLDIVESDKVEVAGYTVKIFDTKLDKSRKEVFGNTDGPIFHGDVDDVTGKLFVVCRMVCLLLCFLDWSVQLTVSLIIRDVGDGWL